MYEKYKNIHKNSDAWQLQDSGYSRTGMSRELIGHTSFCCISNTLFLRERESESK